MLTKYKLKKDDIKYFVHYGPNIKKKKFKHRHMHRKDRKCTKLEY